MKSTEHLVLMRSIAAAGFALLALDAAGQTPPGPVPDPNAPVIVSDEPVKPPSKHRRVERGPVKPPSMPSKPQGEVRRLR